MTWLISDEARKHRAFREVWVAYLLGGLYLLLGLYTEISEQNYSALYDAQQKWLFVQQNIYSYQIQVSDNGNQWSTVYERSDCHGWSAVKGNTGRTILSGRQHLAAGTHGERKRRLQSSIARPLFSSSAQPVCW